MSKVKIFLDRNVYLPEWLSFLAESGQFNYDPSSKQLNNVWSNGDVLVVFGEAIGIEHSRLANNETKAGTHKYQRTVASSLTVHSKAKNTDKAVIEVARNLLSRFPGMTSADPELVQYVR